MFFLGYRNVNGDKIKRTPKNGWFYDPYVIFKKYYKPTDHMIMISSSDYSQSKLEDAIHFVFSHPVEAIGREKPSKVEEFLSVYLGEHVKLTAIEEGCQEWANGQFWRLYFRRE